MRLSLLLILLLISCQESIVVVGDEAFTVEIADDPLEWKIGLMGRKYLGENHGMLFVFDKPLQANFWMKDTLIPLDIIFIDENNTVDTIHRNIQPCKESPCETYVSKNKIKYALEVNGNRAENIKLGDDFKLITRL